MYSGTVKKGLVLVAVAALAAFVVACGTDDTPVTRNDGVGSQPGQDRPDSGDVLVPTDAGFEVVEALAPIDSIQILTLESYPEAFIVEVTSGLPNGCATYSHNEVTRDGTDIKILVYNTVPAPGELIACTEIYRLHDENVGLGRDFERGTTYTVLVNDHPGETFTTGSAPLPSGSTPRAPQIPVGHELVTAPIENLEIIQGQDGRGRTTYSARVAWGLTNGCRESYNRTVSRIDGTTFEIEAIVTSPTGDVICTLDFRIESDDVYLGAVGAELAACTVYHVIAGKLRVSYQATAPNVDCVDPELTPSAGSGGGSIIADSRALEISLESIGATVELVGPSEFTVLFGLRPSEIKVNGQSVQIYEFAPGTSAEKASESVSITGSTIVNPDGSGMSVLWIAPPHFYLFGNSIILYVGTDAEIGALLASVSVPFAGRDFEDLPGGSAGGDAEYSIRTAQIEAVSIASTRSIPAQHLISVTIALGGSCEKFDGIDWSVEGREVIIDVTTKVPTAPVPCTLAIIYEDQSVNIGSDYATGVEYDVIVNGERAGTFVGG